MFADITVTTYWEEWKQLWEVATDVARTAVSEVESGSVDGDVAAA